MAATAVQVLANRENAKRSTGPRTEEGLRRSSLNACRHNLTGGPALAPGEDPAAYQAHLDNFQKNYKPVGDTQTFVVRQIADSIWRLNRCTRMEDELMAMSSNPFAEENDDLLLRLERLQRYRKSIEGTYHRFRREWIELAKTFQQSRNQSGTWSSGHKQSLYDRITAANSNFSRPEAPVTRRL